MFKDPKLNAPQSPPVTIPMLPMGAPPANEPVDFLTECLSPQLSFEAREGQELVQAYMESRSRVESYDEYYAGYIYSPQAKRNNGMYHEDDDTIFRFDL
ncbi:hypothetical protein ACHHYP_13983 [Achlya hypogyna]|uniref:Uncharacterized protein n=1 Tax=Achlya hypogyna TaxID=1202772 RepID=A0A1V9ZF94_ACHHY|nr:hypothetical protein ACHHYP_13983 [Achlya hypogyna]